MSTVLWKIETSGVLSHEGNRCMLKNGLESMVITVEKVLNRISYGMAKEWRIKDKKVKRGQGDWRAGGKGQRGKRKKKGGEAESTRRKARRKGLRQQGEDDG